MPAFDINATCLSFLYGLDAIADSIELGKYSKVLLISSEVASIGLDWEQYESFGLFGDGAVAAIITKSESHESSRILGSYFETYIEGIDFARISGLGSKYHPRRFANIEDCIQACLFYMDGKEVFKLASKHSRQFLENLYKKTNTNPDEIKLVIPHQASGPGLKLFMKRVGLEDKYMYILPEYGNQISVSVPMALQLAIKQNRIQRGDTVMLLGTGAGLTLGGIIMVY